MAVDVVRLGGPKGDEADEVGSRDKGNDQGKD